MHKMHIIVFYFQQIVPIYAAYLYDAVQIYIGALADALESNRSITDGRAIVRKIRNRTYKSKPSV